MNKQNYIERLKIPVDLGDGTTKFFTPSGLLVATGYDRIVIGGRGPYIEFNRSQILHENILVPPKEIWRIDSDISFYIEYRTNDVNNVKIYFQKKTVNYADYKVGFYYISPFDLKTPDINTIIYKIGKSEQFETDKFF